MKRVRNIYFTADLHLGHANSILYDNRPFKDLQEMYRGLIKRFNASVGENDICYFLGDMGFGPDIKNVVDKLNGTKVLILGNHDKKQQAMLNSGFDVVLNSAVMYIAGERVSLSHCPLRGIFREDTSTMKGSIPGENWHKEYKHVMFSIEDEGQFHLHGHLHSPNGGKSETKVGRQWDVGVTGNKYSPVSISRVESWIVRTKRKENENSMHK